MTPEQWERVGQIYQAALELKSADRAAYLDQACGGDHSLRKEVESLLAADGKVGDFLDAGAMGDAAKAMAQGKSLSLIGKKLGPYQVLALIGAGGMGEVYQARDARLNRDVAIKVLPASFAKDADRLRRFEQEARATSALNHPNILTIFDIGAASPELGGAPYIVAELLEGEELRAQLQQGALSQRRVIDYAQQIARGLAAAHERGIVHRDLKPENLFVMKDGRVKILDFGLAKLKSSFIGGAIDTDAPTQRKLTDPGTVLGTVAYMSPEQVRGEEADQRADIFALGVILYEMLAGQRAFTGNSTVEVMNAILKEEPPELSEITAKVSSQLARIVQRCLEKRAPQRFQSASDLGFALEALSSASDSSAANAFDSTLSKRVDWNARIWMMTTGVLALIALVLGVAWLNRTPPAVQTVRLTLLAPEKTDFFRRNYALSPDGRQLAFSAVDAAGKVMLYVRALNSFNAQLLPGTEDAYQPFWSPDSGSIGFFSQKKLKRIEVAGGLPQTICEAPDSLGGSWNRENQIILSPTITNRALYRVPATGGTPVPVTTLDSSRSEFIHASPQFLPDGQHFLYYAENNLHVQQGVYVGSLSDRTTKLVLESESLAQYAAGHLLFVKDAVLMAQAFDTRALQLTGEPFRIADHVKIRGRNASFSASENGVLAYQSGTGQEPELIWYDRTGHRLGKVGEPADYGSPSLAPDEKQLAVAIRDPQTKTRDIWLFDPARGGAPSRFTSDPADELNPAWSPDGKWILFSSNKRGTRDLYQKSVNTNQEEELLFASPEVKSVEEVSPDGRWLIYNTVPFGSANTTNNDLWMLPLEGERTPRSLLKTQFSEDRARVSPDGRWVAYRSSETANYEIYIATFPQLNGKRKVSTVGGWEPNWRRDGKELFFIEGSNLMSVEVKSDSRTIETSVPKVLFRADFAGRGRNRYVASGDGQRFLIITQTEDTTPAPINVVVNWTAELKR
ncbi:MAG: serine/threonine-protein kinase [Acidobacteria bacterium]|nr:serine/threonine-protein kinase [Acidobacteriota bacterium]